MTHTIRPANLADAADAALVIELLDAYARDPMGGSEPLSDYARTHLIARLRARNDVVVLLAWCEGTPAGLAVCIEGFSTFACAPLLNIHDFAVLPTFRGRGVARALLDAVDAEARQRGCCKITLEVLEGNTPARSLYAAHGFEGYALGDAMGTAVFLQKKLA
jgi:ribosomal protein S18 acetylase RimI-like enzyme